MSVMQRTHVRLTCRFCMGSNKVLQVALGREESDEYKQNISELSNRIRGKIGLFFTKLPQSEVNASAHHAYRWPECICEYKEPSTSYKSAIFVPPRLIAF